MNHTITPGRLAQVLNNVPFKLRVKTSTKAGDGPKFMAFRYDVRSQRTNSIGSPTESEANSYKPNMTELMENTSTFNSRLNPGSECPSPTIPSEKFEEEDKDFVDKMAREILFVVKDREIEWSV